MELYEIQEDNSEAIHGFGEYRFGLIMAVFISFWLAFLSSLMDVLILKKLLRSKSVAIILIGGFIAQSIMIVIIISVTMNFLRGMLSRISQEEVEEIPWVEMVPALVYLVSAVLLAKVFIEIDRKFGPGNLWKMLTGRFFKPREEERIFMFIDMRGSTTIAEKLGHLEFSKLLQDCFHDFTIVDDYRTDIYQYVGDEVVVSWTPKNGFRNNNFLKAFFAFDKVLKRKANYYEKQYGMIPYFKSGVNMGPVIVTEVGDIKQEITYHGDTLNTAARIQDKCNELEAQVLIPESMYNLIKDTEGYHFNDVGRIRLKGKQRELKLYQVTEE